MPVHDTLRAIQWSKDCLILLDQRRLPAATEYLEINHVREVAQAISDMVVRGAPAIGITAAYGVVLAARARYEASSGDWQQSIQPDLKLLAASRPTAVNLFWALRRMQDVIEKLDTDPFVPLLTEAQRIHQEDIDANHRMGELGASLLDGKSVLTHCNAGSLATGGYGTALGVVRSGVAAKCIGTVYADETRPWMQGSRLTAWELMQDSIPVTLVCEGASASLLRAGEVSWVIVGADRVAANGDVANKIGTYGLAVNARQHGVRFMVVAPTSTIDMATQCGDDIHIEVRSEQEILTLAGQHLAAQGAQAWNPVFDVTPAEFVTALVTERGIIHHPNRHKVEALMRN